MNRFKIVLLVCNFCLVLLSTVGAVRASTTTVHIYCCNFSINVAGQPIVQATINSGDTVHWTWDDAMPNHSVTSVAGSGETFDSGLHSGPFTFDHTFATPGTYVYYCQLHGHDNNNGTATGLFGTVTVQSPVRLSAVAITPASVTGGKPSVGKITLNAAAPMGGMPVTLSSANTSVATVPATITVAAGATTANFTVKTKTVVATAKVVVTATAGGVSLTAPITAKPNGPKILVLSPDTIVVGDSSVGFVILDSPAGAAGVTVLLKID